MALKCTNPYCSYGPEWERGQKVTNKDDGTVAECDRADSYSQHPEYNQNGHRNFKGLCLNCLDDDQKEARYA